MNLSLLLRFLHENGPHSRAQLAKHTGLNKTTVSSLVEELLACQLVREAGMEPSAGGRPATLLNLNPQAGCIVGVELGVDFISAVLVDFVGNIVWRCLRETDPAEGQAAIIARTLDLVDEAIAVNSARETRLLGLGLATPGTVKDGLLVFSPNLQWWNVPMGEIFHEHTGLQVVVDNDANAAALGEHLFGVARQARTFVSIFAGVGVGGGLFLDSELYRGAGGFAGEIGHTSLMAESYRPPCRCGNRGCWETFTNQFSVIERVRARLAAGRSSLIPGLMAEQNAPLALPVVILAADSGDVEAREVLAETGSLLGVGVGNLINILNPEMVVLGGPLSLAGEYLLPAMREAAGKIALPEVYQQVQIVLSAFGPDASLMGAVALVVEAVLSNPTSVE